MKWMQQGVMASEVVLAPVVSTLVGYWVDEKFDLFPWTSIAGFLLGCVAGGLMLKELIRKMNKNE